MALLRGDLPLIPSARPAICLVAEVVVNPVSIAGRTDSEVDLRETASLRILSQVSFLAFRMLALRWRITHDRSLATRPLPSKQKQADAPGERNGSGAPPGECVPWAPSTGTCSPRPSVRASRPPWRQRTDAPEYRPAGSVPASGSCARSHASR